MLYFSSDFPDKLPGTCSPRYPIARCFLRLCDEVGLGIQTPGLTFMRDSSCSSDTYQQKKSQTCNVFDEKNNHEWKKKVSSTSSSSRRNIMFLIQDSKSRNSIHNDRSSSGEGLSSSTRVCLYCAKALVHLTKKNLNRCQLCLTYII